MAPGGWLLNIFKRKQDDLLDERFVMHRMAAGSKWINFSEGVFMGMSFALAVFALIMGALAKSHE